MVSHLPLNDCTGDGQLVAAVHEVTDNVDAQLARRNLHLDSSLQRRCCRLCYPAALGCNPWLLLPEAMAEALNLLETSPQVVEAAAFRPKMAGGW